MKTLRAFPCSDLPLLTDARQKEYYNNCYITPVIIQGGSVHAAKNKSHSGDDHPGCC